MRASNAENGVRHVYKNTIVKYFETNETLVCIPRQLKKKY